MGAIAPHVYITKIAEKSQQSAIVKAGYASLAVVAADANKAMLADKPFDVAPLAGRKPGYFADLRKAVEAFANVVQYMDSNGYDTPKGPERVEDCRSTHVWAAGGLSDKLRCALTFACGTPLCPACEAVAGYDRLRRLTDALEYLQTLRAADGKLPYIVLMLTETLPNCPGDKLPAWLDVLFEAHARLLNYKRVKDAVHGSMRMVEITVNTDNPDLYTYHPHLHTILLVEPEYFASKGTKGAENALYLSQADWRKLHTKAVKSACDALVMDVMCRDCGKKCDNKSRTACRREMRKSGELSSLWDAIDPEKHGADSFYLSIKRAYKKGKPETSRFADAATSAAVEACKYICKSADYVRYKPDDNAQCGAEKYVIDYRASSEILYTLWRALHMRRRYVTTGAIRDAFAALGYKSDDDDIIGDVSQVPAEERKPDSSGTTMLMLSDIWQSKHKTGKDGAYYITSVKASTLPGDDLSIFDGVGDGTLQQMAAKNIAKREKREKYKQGVYQKLEKAHGKYQYTGETSPRETGDWTRDQSYIPAVWPDEKPDNNKEE